MMAGAHYFFQLFKRLTLCFFYAHENEKKSETANTGIDVEGGIFQPLIQHGESEDEHEVGGPEAKDGNGRSGAADFIWKDLRDQYSGDWRERQSISADGGQQENRYPPGMAA
jgi:hypothetical protein